MPARTGQIRVCVVVERRYLIQEQPAATVCALRELGHEVQVLQADDAVVELARGAALTGVDLVVARGRTDAVLCFLALAERAGIPTVNTSGAVRGVVHKEVTAVSLGFAGLPVPPTWLLPASRISELPVTAFPLVVKPPTGDNGRGIRVVEDPLEAGSLTSPAELVLAQTLVPFDGEDLKLYVVGDTVVAARKPSPLLALRPRFLGAADPTSSTPRPWPLTAELRDIALTCAALTGLDLLGVDLVLGPDGPVVVEVNDFPNYTAVPDSGRRIAAHLLAADGRSASCVSLC